MTSGIVFDIKRFAVHDGHGIRTTVFFKGCPLSCQWCHNPESIEAKTQIVHKLITLDGNSYKQEEIIGKEMTVQELLHEIEKDRIFFDESDGGVTFSGGEPLFQTKFLQEVLSGCIQRGIHTCVDTSGYAIKNDIISIMNSVDLFLYDLKPIDDSMHQKYTGVSNQRILENLKMLNEKKKEIIIRIPLINEITDTDTNIDQKLVFLAPLSTIKEVNLLLYHKIATAKYKRLGLQYLQFSETSQQKIDKITEKFERAGFKVKIGG